MRPTNLATGKPFAFDYAPTQPVHRDKDGYWMFDAASNRRPMPDWRAAELLAYGHPLIVD